MNEVWNLDPIYKGFDDPAFEADLTALKAAVADYAAFAAELPAADPAAATGCSDHFPADWSGRWGNLPRKSRLRRSAPGFQECNPEAVCWLFEVPLYISQRIPPFSSLYHRPGV